MNKILLTITLLLGLQFFCTNPMQWLENKWKGLEKRWKAAESLVNSTERQMRQAWQDIENGEEVEISLTASARGITSQLAVKNTHEKEVRSIINVCSGTFSILAGAILIGNSNTGVLAKGVGTVTIFGGFWQTWRGIRNLVIIADNYQLS